MIKLRLKDDVDGLRIREAPVDGKSVGQIYKDQLIDCMESAELTRSKIGVKSEWIKIRTADGVEGYTAAWLLVVESGLPPLEDDTKSVEEKTPEKETPKPDSEREKASDDRDDAPILAVKPTIKALRMRAEPVDGDQIGTATDRTVLIVDEDETSARAKIGVEGEWLKIKTVWGASGYVAAWYVEAFDGPIPEVGKVPEALNIVGMNLDAQHPLGAPDPSLLKGMGWVRFGYNVSAAKGSEDIQAAYDRYAPHIERFARAGFKVLLVFTHQTYGEGRNEFWPWPEMTTDKWRTLSGRLSDMVGQIVEQYRGKDVVHAYQVWNEQDAHIGAVASVPMVATDYAIILADMIRAIKAADPTAYVITGGHTGGPGKGAEYARTAINALPNGIEPDGVAFHPYGRGITQPAPPYTIFGHIDDSMNAYLPILPGKPVWITEWGVLDRPNDPPGDILNYAKGLVHYLKTNYPGSVATLIWYAWAMSMHNGYGLVNEQSHPIQPLNDGFRKL